MSLTNRYDFVYLFDVKDGNPNGDPDAGNMPRVDPETGNGLITDVCLKRKVRNFVQMTQGDHSGRQIFIKEKAILNNLIAEAHEQEAVKSKSAGDATAAARDWMCAKYFDIRCFGAVMSTGGKEKNAGQVRGPIQLTFSRSLDPIFAQDHSITRMAVATEKEAKNQHGDNRTMGRKATVPYGLYRCHGFVSAHLAGQTGFSEDDLELFWQALEHMFDHDRSAARGEMTARGLYIFQHSSQLGNAPAHSLFERISAQLQDPSKPPRNFSDYQLSINQDDLPAEINLIRRLG